MDNVRAMVAGRKNGLPTVGIQYATHHQNLDDLLASAAMAAEIGVDYFSVKPVFNRGSVGERIEPDPADGMIEVPNGPGLGIAINRDELERYRTGVIEIG